MSGQPYRYASDPTKFRADYMSTLGLRANIDAMNLDANKTYKATGQLPAVSQMPETRTTSEILADTEKLKVELVNELKELGSSTFAQAIVQRIQNSPLNTNGSLFTFFAQRAPEIVKNVKMQYKYGIRGDANDVERFVAFVEDMYNKAKSLTSTVKSYFNRPSNISSGLPSINELDKLAETFTEISRRVLMRGANNPRFVEGVKRLSRMLEQAKQVLTNQHFILARKAFIESQLETGAEHQDAIDRYHELYVRMNDLLNEFPNKGTMFSLLDQLDMSTKNANMELTQQILTKIAEQLSSVPEMIELSNQLRDFIMVINNNTPAFNPNVELPLPYAIPHDFYDEIPAPQQPIYEGEQPDVFAGLYNEGEQPDVFAGLYNEDELDPGLHVGQFFDFLDPAGYGFKKKTRRGRPKGSGIARPYKEVIRSSMSLTKGIEESPRFVKFGKYLLNMRKLNNEDVFAIKQPSGGNLNDFPSQRISKNLSHVIKKMIGGSVPSYNDFANLSEPEKVYLHKVASKANILDKFSIPAPNKDAKEKDIHDFEVMRGEIMAGNDSKELIKKFKLHLVKLSKNGTLPKKEVAEIMEDILELGM